MVGELRFLLEGDDEPPQVVALDGANVLLLGSQEVGEVADAGDNPIDRLRALALGPGIGSVGYQCVLKRHL